MIMKAIKAIYDGHDVKLTEPVPLKGKTDVLVVFPDVFEKISSREARRLLRGSGKGEGLVKKLLQSRAEDMTLGGR
jgi:hypothetical protein